MAEESAPAAAPPVSSSTFQQAAAAAIATARSPLEVSNEQFRQQQAAKEKPQADITRQNMDVDALTRARQADQQQGNERMQPPKEKAPEPPESDEPLSIEAEPWRKKVKPEVARSEDWKKVHARADDWQKKAETYQRELETLKKGGAPANIADHPEYKQLKAKHDEYYDYIKQVSVERDPEFRNKFDAKREAIIKQAKFAAGGAFDKIEKLLTLPPSDYRDEAIEKAISDFNPSTQARLRGQLIVLSQVDAEREAELASRKATWEAKNQNEQFLQQSARQEREAQLNNALTSRIKDWMDPEDGMPFLQLKEGDEKWNRQVEKRINLAKSIFNGESNPSTLSTAALKAASFDAALTMALEATQEVQRLNEAIAQLRGVQPGGDGLAASIMRSGVNDMMNASTTDRAYVNHFSEALEAARRADHAGGGR